MCGRFVTASSPALLTDRFDVDDVRAGLFEPSYNVAPRELVLVVRERDDQRVLSPVRWGLVPSWAKDPSIGDRMINARADGLAEKPAYKRPFARKRCLIPADGFYEWRVVGPPKTPKGRPQKQPMFIHRRDGEPMAFAGLWDVWKVPDDWEWQPEAPGCGAGTLRRREPGPEPSLATATDVGTAGREAPGPEGRERESWLRSCVIVTTEPNDLLAPIHDRMPVLLPESAWAAWLDPTNDDVGELAKLLVPAPSEQLELWPVSTAVNSADNKGPEVVEPVEAIEPSS
jgi:putative SOS response-associated peptidase YedK